MSVLPTCIYVHQAGCPRRSEEGIRSSGTALTGGFVTMWVLAAEPQSSARAASALNCTTISPCTFNF